MSTIERVAELLGPIEGPTSRSTSRGVADRIELASSEIVELGPYTEIPGPEFKGLAIGVKTRPEPAHPTTTTPRILRVDRELLRRQSILAPDGGRTPNAENFRRIKRQIIANVGRSRAAAPANLVMVTSALPTEGKTFCAVNLAISLALEVDRTVLLVDADVAKPSLPKVLGLKAAQGGLMDLVRGRRSNMAEVVWTTDIGTLSLLSAGTPHQHATEILASEAMKALLADMAERYPDRIVIFDSPPLLVASEASALASQMGQIVLVVEAGKTSASVLKAALGRIESSSITGLILNKGEGTGLGYDYGGYG